jgi:anaerobic selenocysteine-containing dehydrogenase
MKISRRSFLKISGGLGTLAGSVIPLSAIAASAEKAKEAAPAAGSKKAVVTRHVKTTCCHCVNFCGIDVKLENDVIRAIYPDKERAPYYNVGICPKGVSGIFNTYNPYRVKKPLMRTNPKKGLGEDPKWKEISWDEAFDEITRRLKKIKAEDPNKFIWQHGHGKYLIGDKYCKAFAKAFGTRNLVHRTTTCESARHVADEITWGYHGFLPDLKHCNLLLNFGANYYEGEQFSRWLDHATVDAQERGMKAVVIEPRQSHCAAKADQWIPIRPGKDVVLLLGMAKRLIDGGHVDADFLTTYTNAPNLVGSDGALLRDQAGNPLVWDSVSKSAKPYGEGVRPTLAGAHDVGGTKVKTAFQVLADSIADITPEYVEKTTGVSSKTFTTLTDDVIQAAQLGATVIKDGHSLRYRPVAIHTFRGLSAKEFGTQNWRAGLVVQMLLGNVDAVGGVNLHSVYSKPKYLKPSKCEYPPKRIDLQESVFFPHATHNVAQQVAVTMNRPKDFGVTYKPEMQIFYATNRPFSSSDGLAQFESLKQTFNVVIEIVMSEVAEMADIVLPDLTYLESWHLSPTRYTTHTKHTAIRQPVANVYNIPHDAYSILWELAKRLGIQDEYVANINKNWKLKNYPMEAGKDYTAKQATELLWKEKTKGKEFEYALEHGFKGKKLKTEDIYLKGVEAKFKGPGKPKMHFYAEQLVGSLKKVKEQVAKHNIANLDLKYYAMAMDPLPRKEHAFPTPHQQAKDFPFYLITYKRMYRNQAGNTALNPILNMIGADVNENFVLINSGYAAKANIRKGDQVVIETRVGKVQGAAKPTEGIRPDTVAVSYQYGHRSVDFPDYAKKGTWINSVLELHPDVISGMNSFNDTKCKVYKA